MNSPSTAAQRDNRQLLALLSRPVCLVLGHSWDPNPAAHLFDRFRIGPPVVICRRCRITRCLTDIPFEELPAYLIPLMRPSRPIFTVDYPYLPELDGPNPVVSFPPERERRRPSGSVPVTKLRRFGERDWVSRSIMVPLPRAAHGEAEIKF